MLPYICIRGFVYESQSIQQSIVEMSTIFRKHLSPVSKIGILSAIPTVFLPKWRLFHYSVRRCSVSDSIFSVLRERGPTPISKISSELSDSDLEEVSDSGSSIVDLLKRRNDVVVVTIVKSLHIAFLKDMLQQVEPSHKRGVALLLASVAALQCFPKMFSSSSHLSTPVIHVEMLFRIATKEGFTSFFDSSDAVHRILHRYPSLFKLGRNGHVRLSLPSVTSNAITPPTVEMNPSSSSSFAGQLSAKQNMLFSALKKCFSESIYIPLRAWLISTNGFWCSLPLDHLLSRLDDLQKNDPSLIDVRKFGDEPECIFIRILGRQADGLTIEDERKKNIPDIQQKLFMLGNQAAKELQRFISQNRENYLAVLKGLTMNQLNQILTAEIRSQTFQLLFPDMGEKKEFPPEALILLFDRLRHIFDVSFSSGTVRLWSALPPSEQPSTLTWESSPLPLVLRYLLSSLQSHPKSLQQLYECLPSTLQSQLNQLYCQQTKNDVDVVYGSLNLVGDSCERIRLFISQHSMFMFLAQDGLVYTPHLVISQNQKKTVNLSDSEKAIALFNALPCIDAVDLMSFLGSDAGRQLPFPAKTVSETFVSRFPSFFKIYSPFASHRTIVGRVGVSPPPVNFLNPKFESVDDIVKFIALHAVGGVTESAIVNNLSKEGRAWLKRIGTPTELAEQLPMWFDVRRDKFNCGASLITYIPGSRGNLNALSSSSLAGLKLVKNDRKLEKHAREKDEDWHEDWDETPSGVVH